MSKQMVPEVRFDGFEDEWKVSKIKDIANISTGSSNTQDNVEHGQYPFYVRSKTIERSNQYLFDEESVLTVGDGVGTGKVFHYVNGKYDLHQRVYRVFNFNEKINAKYFYFYFSKFFYNRVMSLTAKTSVDSVRYKMISEMGIKYPLLYEQKKISDFLTKLEDKISHSEQNIIKLKNFEQAMLQKMFPKEGEKEPEVRFEGFSGEWKIKNINSIAERYDNLRIPVTARNRIPGDTPYYGANGIQDYVKGYTHNGNYVLLAEDGANDLSAYPVYHVSGKIWVNNHAHVLQGFKNITDNKFLAYILKTIKMERYLVGGSRHKLNASTMMEIELELPNIREQIKIGNFFKNLDNKIELEEQNLEKLQQFKKAMLQKMFI